MVRDQAYNGTQMQGPKGPNRYELTRRFLPAVVGLCAACGPNDDPGEGTVTVEYNNGIEIVSTSSPIWSVTPGAAWMIGSDPALELPGDSEDGDQILYDVLDVKRLQGGRIAVANGGTSQILLFDSAGALRDAWGRLGKGPGEFSGLLGLLQCAGNTLMVRDRSRISVFDEEGRFIRSERLVGNLVPHGAFEIEGIARDCSALLFSVRQIRGPLPGEREFRYPTQVYWAAVDGANSLAIGSFPGNELIAVDVGVTVGARFAFAVEPRWTTDGESVYYGPADRFEIQVFDGAGSLSRIVRWGAQREPVTDADWADYAEERRRRIALDPAEEAVIPRRQDHPNPEFKPAYSDILVDDRGNLWVQRYVSSFFLELERDEVQRWWILDGRGRWLGSVELPPRFRLKAVSDGFVIGVFSDELDVERVQLFRLRQPPS